MNDTITIIIPTYNKVDYISQTIESALNQTYSNYEILIVDDASSDGTDLVIKKYISDKVRYIKHEKNLGPSITYNDGIRMAKSEYVTILDNDDVLLPCHLDLVIDEFKKNKRAEAVFTKLKVIDEHNRDLKKTISPPFNDKYQLLNHLFYQGNDIPSPGVSFKKSVFEKIPAFNPSLILMHDYDLNVRLLMYAETVNISKPTVLYRRFSDNKNLSSDNNWYKVCHRAESKVVLDNYLTMDYGDMVKVFPYLKPYKEEQCKFQFLIETCKLSNRQLSDWAFEKLIHYLNEHQTFFADNDFHFQYKDYINLYKACTIGTVGSAHKRRLYNAVKNIGKLLFGMKE